MIPQRTPDMPKYRLLAIDIDGTLVNSRDELTPRVRAALTRAGRSGIRIVLASGRRYSRVLPLVEPLALDVPLVTASGALVKDPQDHRTLFRAEFAEEVLRGTIAAVDRAGFDPLLCGDTFLQGFDFYAPTTLRREEAREYVQRNRGDGRLCPVMLRHPPSEVFLVFTLGTQEQMLSLQAQLHEQLSGQIATHVLRTPRYTSYLCEIAPAGVSKWAAVRRLAEQWAIADAEICAVGDDVNDIAMIRAAGLGVAMGNAQPEVKAAADRIAPSHDEDGLAEVVRWLLEER
jgi:Cof subfamily protein (haloacid dehalogenase superfamily)